MSSGQEANRQSLVRTPNRSSRFFHTSSPSMLKIFFGRNKRIQVGLPRHRVGSKKISGGEEDESQEDEDGKFLGLRRSKYSAIGQKSCDIITASCEKFHLLGFTRTQNSEYVPLSKKARIWHYVACVCCLAICIQRVWGTAREFLYEELGMESFLCLCLVLVYAAPTFLGLPIVMRSKETMDLLNSWSITSASLKNSDPNSKFHPLNNMSTCLKVISGFQTHQQLAVMVAMVSIVMSDLPIFLLPTLRNLGLLPEGILPKWVWQIMFVPFEYLMALPFMLIAQFSESCLYMGNGAIDVYLKRLRSMQVSSLEARQKLEQMYVELELFSKVYQVWLRFFFPPWVFGLANVVIVGAIVTIRYTELPLSLYAFFPVVVVAIMVLISWQSYDMLRVVRTSQDILENLWRHDAPYFQRMTRTERVELMKRSKAMRPLMFILGDSQFNLNLPINTWNEILNQTLFFLSL